MASSFTHFDEHGRVHMVDVTAKQETARVAHAIAIIRMSDLAAEQIQALQVKKGDVLAIAELAAVMGAKQTANLIPLCHPLALSHVSARCEWIPCDLEGQQRLSITSTVRTTGQTGVEMEALTACSVAALTVYDMCKAVDRAMVIEQIRLLHKSGGKSGDFFAPPNPL